MTQNWKKIATHVHTAPLSGCAKVPAEEVPVRYRDAGFDAIVVTNHWMDDVWERYYGLDSAAERAEHFLSGYLRAKEVGERIGISVWLGAELNPSCYNVPEHPHYPIREFLIYGLTESFVRERPEWYRDSQEEIFRTCNEQGFVMVQSHPFRLPTRPGDPEFLHGAEVFNGNPRAENRNDLALQWAREHHLLEAAGDDFHQIGDEGHFATLAPPDVSTYADFVAALAGGRTRTVRL